MLDTTWIKTVDQYVYSIQKQDKLALEQLYQHTAGKLFGLILRIIHDKHEAEECLQEVFIKVWQQAHKYTGSGSAWGWLCVLARHNAIDRLRKLNAHPHQSTDQDADGLAPQDLLQQLIEDNDLSNTHWLGQCLVHLKPQTQQVILLSSVHGYSHSEIVDKLELPLGTIKAWIRRGLQELKQCLTA